MKKFSAILFVVFILLLYGCLELNSQYFFINKLNVSCKIPKDIFFDINKLDWQKQDENVFIGTTCEAFMKECSAEIEIFKSNQGALRHRIHYYGSPDDTYYLIYNDKKYDCIKKNIESQ